MFQTMIAVDKVQTFITDSLKKLSIAIFDILNSHAFNKGEELHVKRKRIRLSADIHPMANEISSRKVWIMRSPNNSLATFLHTVAATPLYLSSYQRHDNSLAQPKTASLSTKVAVPVHCFRFWPVRERRPLRRPKRTP